MKLKFAIFSLGAIVVLSGCAAPRYIAIEKDVQESISSSDVHIAKANELMSAQIECSQVSTYTGGGLLPALVDVAINASRQEDADTALNPVQEHMQKIDINKTLQDNLIPIFKGTDWLRSKSINISETMDQFEIEKLVDQTQSDSVLFVRFAYELTPTFSILKGTLYVELYAAKDMNEKTKKGDIIFKNDVNTSRFLHHARHTMKENAETWCKDDGQYLVLTLNSMIRELSEKMAFELKNPTLNS